MSLRFLIDEDTPLSLAYELRAPGQGALVIPRPSGYRIRQAERN